MGIGALIWVILWFIPGYLFVKRKHIVEETNPAIALSALLSLTVPFYISYVLSLYANTGADLSFLLGYLIMVLLSLKDIRIDLGSIADKFSR